ncbi:DUF4381 domain-containing protein [Shewanella litorisediminis]|uniref:DUF4381 domain-containing protein n=1 Tax=Shewanella litorisediminis TaxID=1173586 RepID=A0ABX7FZI5_9GAMM|nr:DUF4381 domain-containing protein [Shewanella litorisediminis]MCL2919514.1 DUF4381 domain-containing protein [Shewanella litorisediminis]QRH00448.1 DUF4381 domain-containing protein [Shewanella litorisediminis]
MLAQMKDIQLPPEVSAWPPAPWVWPVLAILLGLLALGFWRWLKYRAAKQALLKPRAEALALLAELSPTHPGFALDLSGLLKRVAMRYYPRAQIASLTGNAWAEFLASRYPNRQGLDVFQLMAQAAYRQAPLSAEDADALKQEAQRWIASLPHKPLASDTNSGEAKVC